MRRNLLTFFLIILPVANGVSYGSTGYLDVLFKEITQELYNNYQESFQKYIKVMTHIEVFTNEVQSKIEEKCSSAEKIWCDLDDDLNELNQIRGAFKKLIVRSLNFDDSCSDSASYDRFNQKVQKKSQLGVLELEKDRKKFNRERRDSSSENFKLLACQWDTMFELKKQNSIILNKFEGKLASIYDNYRNCMSASLKLLYNDEQC